MALISNTSNSNRFLGETSSGSNLYKAYATSNLSSYAHDFTVYIVEEEDFSSLTPSNLALIDAPIAFTFDLYNNSAAQTIHYTTSGTGAVTSPLITITQAGIDYTTLPFAWAGGTSSALTSTAGVTASGLGSDYADTDANKPYLV